MGRARLGIAFLLPFTLACAALRPIETDVPLVLGPEEGILLLDVVSNFPIRAIRVSGPSVREIPEGHSQRLFVIREGKYRWVSISTQGMRFRLNDSEEWSFRIEAGRINYPGLLSSHTTVSTVWKRGLRSVGRMEVHSINRSAIARAELERSFPRLLERYPMTYTGHVHDEFLERFDEARRGLPDTSAEPLPDAEAVAE